MVPMVYIIYPCTNILCRFSTFADIYDGNMYTGSELPVYLSFAPPLVFGLWRATLQFSERR